MKKFAFNGISNDIIVERNRYTQSLSNTFNVIYAFLSAFF